MASKIFWKLGISILLLCALSAIAHLCIGNPRLLVLIGLIGSILVAYLIQILRKLSVLISIQDEYFHATSATIFPDQQKIELQLEFAPIALFSLSNSAPTTSLLPLNARARQLISPTRITDLSALHHELNTINANQRRVITYESERGRERAILAVTDLTLSGQRQQLLALMPIESELEAEALTAWRQLVHVLTHEIMNSLTPIASLSNSAQDLIQDAENNSSNAEMADLRIALNAIQRRALSLQSFVTAYRSLSHIPAPKPEVLALESAFQRLYALLSPDWHARKGTIQFIVEPKSLQLQIDPGQFEQALINLLKNAADATEGKAQPQVIVSASLNPAGKLRIEIADNGPGVPDGLIANIFTPFFTTKDHGNGIGLAMVRQLIHANNGTVRYAKTISGGACFVLSF